MIRKGTLVFPRTDRDFLQQLEMRGNNGGVETVETVYALTGSTYYVPEWLIALDDPSLYKAANPNRVKTDGWEVARTIDEFHKERPGPRMLVRVHTHPSGGTRPSDGDREAAANREFLYRQFDDCEFFLGIHGLGEECSPDSEWLRRPEQTDENEISWWGENRKHSLAIYDTSYEPAPVVVTTAAELQQQQQRTRRPPDPGSGPGPGGEIWD